MLGSRPPTVAPPGAPEAAAPVAPAPPEPEQPDALATDVARAVRELRTAAGLSERAAARLLATSQTQLRRMEDPRYLPSLRSLVRVASAYGHRVRVLFEPKEPKAPTRPSRSAPRAKPAPARRSRGRTDRAKAGRTRRRP